MPNEKQTMKPDLISGEVTNLGTKSITETNTDPALNSIPDSDVQKAADEASQSIAETMSTVSESQAASIDDKNKGMPGKSVTGAMRGSTGAITPVSAVGLRALSRFAIDLPGEETQATVSDADHFERNSEMATRKLDQAQSVIVHEGTRATVNPADSIVGLPSDNNVYSEESTIVAETITNRLTKYGAQHPRHRGVGTKFVRGQAMISSSGDYIYATDDGSGNIVAGSHAAKKGVTEYENLLFQKLTSDGLYAKNQFVAPKQGIFWLKGINLCPSMADPNITQAYVKRNLYDPTRDSFIDQPCPVSYATGNGIFEVEELTPTIDKMEQVSASAVEYLTCNAGKMAYGYSERVAQVIKLNQNQVSVDDTIKYPEAAQYANRCSLYSLDGQAGDTVTTSCKNDMEQVIDFIHRLTESDGVMFLKTRVNLATLRDNLKFYKGQEGQNSSYPYWNDVAQASPILSNLNHPTLASYLRTYRSPSAFNSLGKLLYGFKAFWADLDAALMMFDNDLTAKTLLSDVRIQAEVVSALMNNLGVGTLSPADELTSNAVIADANTVDILLSYDPNDLVNYIPVSDSTSAATPRHVSVWPACGYINVFTRNTAANAQSVVYSVLPFWMEVIVAAMNSSGFNQRVMFSYDSNNNQINPMDYYRWSKSYTQLNFDTMIPSFYDFYFVDATRTFFDRIFTSMNQRSAYIRWIAMLKEFGCDSVYSDDVKSLSSAITEIVGNDGLYHRSTYTKPSDFKELWREAVIERYYEPFNTQIALFSNIDLKPFGLVPNGDTFDRTTRAGSGNSMLVMSPGRFDQYLFGLQSWNLFKCVSSNGDLAAAEIDAANMLDLYQETLNNVLTNSNDGPSGLFVWPDDYSTDSTNAYLSPCFHSCAGLQVLLNMVSDGEKSHPVICKRNADMQGSITVPVLVAEANPDIQDFDENPESAMYGHDGFQLVTPFDGYVMLVDQGKSVKELSSDTASAGGPAVNNHMMAPFIASDSPADNGSSTSANRAFGRQLPSSNIAFYSRNASANNQLYTSNALTTELWFRPEGGNTYSYTPQRIMSRPSLYGYRRYVPFGVTIKQLSASGAYTVETRKRSVNALIETGSGDNFFNDGQPVGQMQILTYLPEVDTYQPTVDGTIAGPVPTTPNEWAQLFTVDTAAIGNWKWYAGQRVFCTNYAGFTSHAEDTVSYEYLAKLVGEPLMPFNAYLLNADNADDPETYTTDEVATTQRARFGFTGSTGDAKDSRVYADGFAFRHPKLYAPLFPNPTYVAQTDYEYSILTNNYNGSTYHFVSTHFANQNPEINSRFYYNDTRLFLSDKPAIRLNKNWNAIAFTECLLAKQYDLK